MFSLTETDLTLVNVNPRTEKHGEDSVLAADFKLSFKTELRFPQIGRLHWEKKFSGYTLRVHQGASGIDDVVLQDCQIDKFAFDCLDGGSVVFTFRVQGHPDAAQVGKLCALIQQQIMVTLEPPEAEA